MKRNGFALLPSMKAVNAGLNCFDFSAATMSSRPAPRPCGERGVVGGSALALMVAGRVLPGRGQTGAARGGGRSPGPRGVVPAAAIVHIHSCRSLHGMVVGLTAPRRSCGHTRESSRERGRQRSRLASGETSRRASGARRCGVGEATVSVSFGSHPGGLSVRPDELCCQRGGGAQLWSSCNGGLIRFQTRRISTATLELQRGLQPLARGE